MYRLTVLYGFPTDPEEFDRYYHETHIPIAKKMKGLKGWTIGKCEAIEDGTQPPYYMTVALFADSAEHMQSILESPEGQATIDDVPNFATGGVTMFYSDDEVLVPLN